MGYSKNKEAAKEFIKYLMDYNNYVEWLKAGQGFSTAPTKVFAKDPLWGELDPQVEPFKDIVKYGRHFGYAGPASRKAAEAGRSTSSSTCSPRRCRGRRLKRPSSGRPVS